MQRHDLVFVKPTAWLNLINDRDDLRADAVVAPWVNNGWPLISRRGASGEQGGVPLGLPLPPSMGKGRLCFVVDHDDVLRIAKPLLLKAVMEAAPRRWWKTIRALEGVASRHLLDARVFGSLGWQALTGLEYVTDVSDLDLLWEVNSDTDLRALSDELATVEASSPVRLDGEFVREDGCAVNWREIHGTASELLVKSLQGIALTAREDFIEREIL